MKKQEKRVHILNKTEVTLATAILILFVLFSVTTDSFFSEYNLSNLLKQSAIVGVLSVGAMSIVLTGGIDLSAGSLTGMGALIVAIMMTKYELPIWASVVIAILVCVGFGPSAGIIGICIFSTSFFARSFAQCYEEVPQETLEALRAMGAGRVKVFFSAVLPSAFTGMLAWTSISFESNFEASAVLGTVGAGGIGYVISNCMTRYAYGQAIVAIALVLAFTYAMELGFTAIKERNGKIK